MAADLWGRYGDGISSLSVVFPSRRASLFFGDALGGVIDRPLWQPASVTVDELAEDLSGLLVGDRLRLVTELFKVYHEFHPEESFDSFYFWGELLLGDFDSIDKYLVDAETLFSNLIDLHALDDRFDYLEPEARAAIERFWGTFPRAARTESARTEPATTIASAPDDPAVTPPSPPMSSPADLSREQHSFLDIWRTLHPIYRRFRERLRNEGIAYQGMVYREAAEMIASGHAPQLPDRKYIIIGFNALSRCEQVIFDHLRRQAHVDFYWDYDDYFVSEVHQEAGMFMRDNLRRFPPVSGFRGRHDNFVKPKEIRSIAVASDVLQCKWAGLRLAEFAHEKTTSAAATQDTNNQLVATQNTSAPYAATQSAATQQITTQNISAPPSAATQNTVSQNIAKPDPSASAPSSSAPSPSTPPSPAPSTSPPPTLAPPTLGKETAIVLCDESLLVPLLWSMPQEVASINITMGYPLRMHPVYTFVERLVELQNRRRDGRPRLSVSGQPQVAKSEVHLRNPKNDPYTQTTDYKEDSQSPESEHSGTHSGTHGASQPSFYHSDVDGLLRHPYLSGLSARPPAQNDFVYVSASRLQTSPIFKKIFSIPSRRPNEKTGHNDENRVGNDDGNSSGGGSDSSGNFDNNHNFDDSRNFCAPVVGSNSGNSSDLGGNSSNASNVNSVSNIGDSNSVSGISSNFGGNSSDASRVSNGSDTSTVSGVSGNASNVNSVSNGSDISGNISNNNSNTENPRSDWRALSDWLIDVLTEIDHAAPTAPAAPADTHPAKPIVGNSGSSTFHAADSEVSPTAPPTDLMPPPPIDHTSYHTTDHPAYNPVDQLIDHHNDHRQTGPHASDSHRGFLSVSDQLPFPEPEPKLAPKSDPKPESQPKPKSDPKPESQPDPKPEPKPEPQPEPKPDSASAHPVGMRSELFALIIEHLRRLANSLEGCGIELSTKTYTKLLRRSLQSVTLPFEGEPLDGVQVMGILETRTLDFENVILLSTDDATMPGSLVGAPSFIPYNLKAAYGLPTPEHHEGVWAYHFFRLIGRARRVDMLWSRTVDDRTAGSPSRYILQLDYESPHNVEKENVTVDVSISPADPVVVEKGPSVMEKLRDFLAPERPVGDDSTVGNTPPCTSPVRRLSPSLFFSYTECPLKFYFRGVARLRPEEEVSEDFDGALLGNILHRAMELLYAPLKGITDPREQIGRLVDSAKVDQAVTRALTELRPGEEGSGPEDWGGTMILAHKTIADYINRAILPYDASQPESFTIVSLEKRIETAVDFTSDTSGSTSKNTPGITSGRVVFSGIADRIDRLPNGTLRVVDYKTGNPKKTASALLQMGLYAMMLGNDTAEYFTEIIPTLYYVRDMTRPTHPTHPKSSARYTPPPVDISPDFEQQLRATLAELFDPATPFTQTADPKPCNWCDFAAICRR